MTAHRVHPAGSFPPLLLDDRIFFRRTRARIDDTLALAWCLVELWRALRAAARGRRRPVETPVSES